jgi:hypothetical protein
LRCGSGVSTDAAERQGRMNVTSVTVETRRRDDAACIARALDAPISRSARGWLVTFEIEASNDLGSFLRALQSCLNEAEIPMVTVAFDDVRYAMEAEGPRRRIGNVARISRLAGPARSSRPRTPA